MERGNFSFEEFGRKVTATAAEGLAHAMSAADVAVTTARTNVFAEKTITALTATSVCPLIACAPGCSACCTVNVAILLPEAIAIADYLTERLDPGLLAVVKESIDEVAAKVRWMDDSERIRRRVQCAFLDSAGLCVIHPVRPFTCRALTSSDPEQCRRALDSRDTDEEETVLSNLIQRLLMEETYRGMADALGRLGLDSRGWELHGAVKRVLDSPALVDDFLAGVKVERE